MAALYVDFGKVLVALYAYTPLPLGALAVARACRGGLSKPDVANAAEVREKWPAGAR